MTLLEEIKAVLEDQHGKILFPVLCAQLNVWNSRQIREACEKCLDIKMIRYPRSFHRVTIIEELVFIHLTQEVSQINTPLPYEIRTLISQHGGLKFLDLLRLLANEYDPETVEKTCRNCPDLKVLDYHCIATDFSREKMFIYTE